jgi:hypothetical protein
MGSKTRVAVMRIESHKNRAAAWDQVSPGELAFDFNSPPPKPLSLDWPLKEKVGVKEAIIRWLEEQL